MAELKKILVSLPDSLLQEVDEIVAMEQKNRSEFIREAMKLYIRERHKIEIREKMRKGYEEMAKINIQLTEVGANCDNQALEAYEAILSECE
ncbi:MAG: ribbon-helix-helix protein, CopG family [Xylanivirga thermophila]|uniref:CopG family ribbon-helix-helix protein n=1 Tax=Xylanivirga thermophila TaxID=2496273 RepID=UPI00101D1C5F|nr:ribbon-helix-helix protein, CopG family [Xylanivirga thermophila]